MIPIYMKWTILWTVIISHYAGAQNLDRKIIVKGVAREYILHVPSIIKTPNKIPLMLVFHGGGGSARNAISFFGMNSVADTAGFIIAYPNGLDKGWNDGRTIKNHTHDDVGFVRQLIQQVSKEYPIDRQRIFATGISNGGFFSFMLEIGRAHV